MLNETFFEKLKEKIQPYFEEAGSHDFSHTQRVYNLAVEIGKKEKADLDIIKAAAFLHDIARLKEDNKECECHAEEGGKIAEKILAEMNFSYDKIENVVHSIKVHRYSKKLNAETKEAKILQDADRLDALGAITIARIFAYGGKKNRKIHNPELKPQEYKHNSESASSFIHFYEKILKIKPDTFNTKEARKIAKGRYKFVEEYVDRFLKEWDGKL